MTAYRSTQVYLEEDQHQAVKEEARRRGISMAELIRCLVEEGVCSGTGATDLSSLEGIVVGGQKTNFARDKQQIVVDAYSSGR